MIRHPAVLDMEEDPGYQELSPIEKTQALGRLFDQDTNERFKKQSPEIQRITRQSFIQDHLPNYDRRLPEIAAWDNDPEYRRMSFQEKAGQLSSFFDQHATGQYRRMHPLEQERVKGEFVQDHLTPYIGQKRELSSEERREHARENMSAFRRSLEAGYHQYGPGFVHGLTGLTGSLLEGVPGLSRVGERLKEGGAERHAASMQRAYERPQNIESIKDIGSFTDFLTWAGEQTVKFLPQMGMMMLGGLALKPIAGKAVGAMAASKLGDAFAKRAAAKMAAKQGITSETARQQLVSSMAVRLGAATQVTGMYGGSNWAEVYGDFGIDRPSTALATALGAGLLTMIGGQTKAIEAVLGRAKGQALREALNTSNMGIASRIAVEFAKTAPKAAVEEFGQESLALMNRVVNDPDRAESILEAYAEDIWRPTESALTVGVAAAGPRAVISGAAGRKAKAKEKPPEGSPEDLSIRDIKTPPSDKTPPTSPVQKEDQPGQLPPATPAGQQAGPTPTEKAPKDTDKEIDVTSEADLEAVPEKDLDEAITEGIDKRIAAVTERLRGALKKGEYGKADVYGKQLKSLQEKQAELQETIPAPKIEQVFTPREDVSKEQVPEPKTPKRDSIHVENMGPVEVEYRLAEADVLIPSNNPLSFHTDKRLPEDLQPRDRKRLELRLQVTKIAKKLDPKRLYAAPTPAHGAPLAKNTYVVGGHGRVMAIQQAYELGLANELKQYYIDHAEEFGYTPEQVKAMKRPVVYREVVSDDIDLKKLALNTNDPGTARMSATETASADQDVLSEGLMAKYRPGKDGELNVATNQGFLSSFVSGTGSDASRLVTADGKINKQGLERVKAALFDKAYGKNNDLAVMQAEDASPDSRNIIRALEMASGEIVRSRVMGKGDLTEETVKHLLEAVRAIRQSRSQQVSIEQIFDQIGMFDTYSEESKIIARYIDKNIRSAKAIGEFTKEVASQLIKAGDKQAEIFGETDKAKTTGEVIQRAIDAVKSEDKQQGIDFETEGKTPEKTGEVEGKKAWEMSREEFAMLGIEKNFAKKGDKWFGQYTNKGGQLDFQEVPQQEIDRLKNEVFAGSHKLRVAEALSSGELTTEQAEKLGHFEAYPDLKKAPDEQVQPPSVAPATPDVAEAKEPYQMTRGDYVGGLLAKPDPGTTTVSVGTKDSYEKTTLEDLLAKGEITKKEFEKRRYGGLTRKQHYQNIGYAMHLSAIQKALKSGDLTPAEYKELHEKDYGPIEKFAPDTKAKDEGDLAPISEGAKWAREKYKDFDISKTDPRDKDNPITKALRLAEVAKRKIEQIRGAVKLKNREGYATPDRPLTQKDLKAIKFWEDVRDEANKIWEEEFNKVEGQPPTAPEGQEAPKKDIKELEPLAKELWEIKRDEDAYEKEHGELPGYMNEIASDAAKRFFGIDISAAGSTQLLVDKLKEYGLETEGALVKIREAFPEKTTDTEVGQPPTLPEPTETAEAEVDTETAEADQKPLFIDYAGARDWIEQKSKEHGGKDKFLSSQEYKDAKPYIDQLYEADMTKWRAKAGDAMAEVGVSYGDKVSYGVPSLMGGTQVITGKIVERSKLPWVELDKESAALVNRSRVRWHKGWVGEGKPKKIKEAEAATPEALQAAIEKLKAETPGRRIFGIHLVRQAMGSPENFNEVLEQARKDQAIQLHGGDPSIMTQEQIKDSYKDARGDLFVGVSWIGKAPIEKPAPTQDDVSQEAPGTEGEIDFEKGFREAKFNKKNIFPRDSQGKVLKPVVALVYGDYGYFKAKGEDNYTIVHVPSGRYVYEVTFDAPARELTYRFELFGEKWDGKGEPPKGFSEKGGEIINEFYFDNRPDLPTLKPLFAKDYEALDKFLKDTKNTLATTETVDWGKRDRKKGKRAGTMVTGAMSDAPQGEKKYVDLIGKLAKLEPESYEDASTIFSDNTANLQRYARLRSKGYFHDESVNLLVKLEERSKAKPKQPATGKIEDFGEVLEGAKKHYFQDYASKMKDVPDSEIVNKPLSKSWPQPDYQKMIDEGANPLAVAFTRVARDSIPPNKPKKYKYQLDQWAENVRLLRDTSQKLISGDISIEKLQELMEAPEYRSLKPIFDTMALYEAVGHEKSLKGIKLTDGQYGVYKGIEYSPPKTIWTVEQKKKGSAWSNWPSIIAEGDTKEQAIEDFKKKYDDLEVTQKKGEKSNRYEIRQYVFRHTDPTKRGKYFITRKGTDNFEFKRFDSAEAAREFLQTNQEWLDGQVEKFKLVPDERSEFNAPRLGEDHRDGLDVSPEKFDETFGFRGVQFGNYVEQGRRQQDINEAYDALMDLAGVLNLPAKALSLDGELGLAFGARGSGKAKAHYEPSTIVINLTKTRGAGSLAHEWWHAVDNFFARKRGEAIGYLSESPREKGEGVRPELIHSFKGIMDALKESGILDRARRLDKKRTKAYWGTPVELTARSFESYIIDKLKEQGGKNDYLANVVSQEAWEAAAAMGLELEGSYPYLTEAELPKVREAFEAFFDTASELKGRLEKGKQLTEQSVSETPKEVFSKDELSQRAKGAYASGDLDAMQYMTVLDLLVKNELESVSKILAVVDQANKDNTAARTIGEIKKTKATVKADLERLVKLLGSQMYKANLAEVTVKETIQNSFDAIKASLNLGLETEGKIDVLFDSQSNIIAIKDNGQGMTPKTIREAFLTIGGTEKSGLKVGESSGGHGMAKAAYLLGNQWLYVRTSKDGVRSSFKTTAAEIFSKNIIIEEMAVDKSEHGTLLIIKVPDVLEVDGENQTVFFPYGLYDVSFFNKPLIHDKVTVRTLFANLYEDAEAVLKDPDAGPWTSPDYSHMWQEAPIGKNYDLSKYKKHTSAKFSWGSADIYIGIERENRPYFIKHEMLSSGLYQFNDEIQMGLREKVPYNVLINVFPKGKSDSPSYPFDLKREGWRSTIEKDVKALKKYIGNVAAGVEAQQTVDSFKHIRSLPRLDVETIGTANVDVSEFIKPLKPEKKAEKVEVYVPPDVKIKGGVVTGKNEKNKTVEYVNLEKERQQAQEKLKESFKPDKEAPKARDFLLKMDIDDKKPVFHNNTNIDYQQIAAENNFNADLFFAEIGSVMLKVKDLVIEKGGYYYNKFRDENSQLFVGISIDKKYHGVNIPVPFKGVFLNPLAIREKTLPGLAFSYFNTTLHEMAHLVEANHEEGFTGELARLETIFASDGTDLEVRMALARVLKKHEGIVNLLRGEFEKSTTRNVAKSLHETEEGGGGVAKRRLDAGDGGTQDVSSTAQGSLHREGSGAAGQGVRPDAGSGKEGEQLRGTSGGIQVSQVGDDVRFSRSDFKTFSQLEQVLSKPGMLPKNSTRKGMTNATKKHVGKFKGVELNESGLLEHIQSMKQDMVTRQDVLDYLDMNRIELKEVVKGDPQKKRQYDPDYDPAIDAPTETQFSQYQMEGDKKNYREVLLVMPVKGKIPNKKEIVEAATQRFLDAGFSAEDARRLAETEDAQAVERSAQNWHQGIYRSSHWDEPNVLLHVRMNDRIDTDGKKTLVVEEDQSDWHQKGRKKGYKGVAKDLPDGWEVYDAKGAKDPQYRDFYGVVDRKNRKSIVSPDQKLSKAEAIQKALTIAYPDRVPDAPFKPTDRWAMLGMKRVIAEAVAKGYDRVQWTPGEVQADRYDLSKQVSSIGYKKAGDNKYDFVVKAGPNDQRFYDEKGISLEKVEELAGKEIAQKVKDGIGYDDGTWMILDGENLKVGGEGMKGFYDKILPKEVGKYIKKWGSKVEVKTIEGKGYLSSKRIYEGPELSRKEMAGLLSKLDNASAEASAKEVIKALGRGEIFKAAMEQYGNGMLSDAIGGRFVLDKTQEVWSFDITPQMRESVMTEGQPLYSQKKESGATAQVGKLQSSVDKLMVKFPGLKKDMVRPFQSESQLPERLQATLKKQNMAGKYDAMIWEGDIYLVADNLTEGSVTALSVMEGLLRHEGRHYAIEQIFGGKDSRDKFFGQVAEKYSSSVDDYLRKHKLENTPENRIIAAEEVIIDRIKAGETGGVIDRFIARIANFLRTLFPKLKISNAEVRMLIARADQIIEGKGEVAPIGQLADNARFKAEEIKAYDDALHAHDYVGLRAGRKLTDTEKRVRKMAYGIKLAEAKELKAAAAEMAAKIPGDPSNAILVPIPGHTGETAVNLTLAKEIAKITGGKVQDVLKRIPGESQKDRRAKGLRGQKPGELATLTTKEVGDVENVYFVDNVISSGATIRAARDAVGGGRGLVFAKAFSKGPKYIMGGKRFATDEGLARLETAQRMIGDPEKIWRETGWWRLGKDWKFEIDPENATIYKDRFNDHAITSIEEVLPEGQKLIGKMKIGDQVEDGWTTGTVPLFTIYDHPELYKLYPMAKNIQISFNFDPRGGAFRSSSENLISLPLGPVTGKDILAWVKEGRIPVDKYRGFLEHEIQHAVQEWEGFPRGGDPNALVEPELKTKIEKARDRYKELDKKGPNQRTGIETAEYNQLQMRLQKLMSKAQIQGYGRYMTLPGEAEARMVRIRLHMTPKERKAEPPWVTLEEMLIAEGLLKEGQKLEDVLVDRRRGGQAFSVEGEPDFKPVNTSSKEFKNWFGDSKVVDGDGRPLRVYHGTGKDFTFFDKDAKNTHAIDTRQGEAYFFSDKTDLPNAMVPDIGGQVLPVYLSIKNPHINQIRAMVPSLIAQEIKYAKENGHDGVALSSFVSKDDSVDTGNFFIAFSPAQIKSAISNIGEFSKTDPDIRFSRKPGPSKEEASSRYPEVQKRFKAAQQGIERPTFGQKAKDFFTQAKDTFTRHDIHLDPKKDGAVTDILRRFQEVPSTMWEQAGYHTVRFLKDMDQSSRDVFTYNLVDGDMLRDIDSGVIQLQKGEQLPFGYKDIGEVQADYDHFKQVAENNPEVKKALEERAKFMGKLRKDLVKHKLLPKDILKGDPNEYFHHQVLDYMALKQSPGISSKDVRTKRKGWQFARAGSLKDYSTNYLESEIEVVSQGLVQVKTQETLDRIRKLTDMKQELETDAYNQNIAAVEEMMGGLEDPLKPFKVNMAIGFSRLEKMAGKGELYAPPEYQDIVDDLAEIYFTKKDMDKEDARFVRSTHPKIFQFLSWLINTKNDGAAEAATIFKAIKNRNKFIKDSLGKNFKTYRNLIPEGYEEWKPKPGQAFYFTNSLTDKILEDVLSGHKSLEEKDVQKVLARGRDAVWVIPDRVAATLDEFKPPRIDSLPEKISVGLMSKWKQWILINPYRIVRYNINNMSGDLDIALAYDPRIAIVSLGAARDLWKAYGKGKWKIDDALRRELYEARVAGVIGTGMTQMDIPDIGMINKMDEFMDVLDGKPPKGLLQKSKKGLTWFWEHSKGLTTWRENILRLGAYRHFKDLLSKPGGKNVYAASKKSEIDAMWASGASKDEIAAKLSRELVGDYGNISHGGQWLRHKLIPFYSWIEINAPRYVRLLRNLKHEDRSTAGLGGVMAWKATKLGLKAGMLFGLVNLWNATVFPEEDEILGEYKRRQMHLILGRRQDGSIVTLRFQGALSDALSWFGQEDPLETYRMLSKGEYAEELKRVVEAPAEKIITGVRPEPKLLFEGLTGSSLFPDPFSPKPIRDRAQHLLRTFSLDKLYNIAAGKPSKAGGWEKQFVADLKTMFVYEVDPGETAYWELRSQVFDYLKKQGHQAPSVHPTNKSNALYYYRQAIKYGDLTAAARYYEKYIEYGGNARGIAGSIRRAHPLSSLPLKERYGFRQTLSEKDLRTLGVALEWYRDTYLAKITKQ